MLTKSWITKSFFWGSGVNSGGRENDFVIHDFVKPFLNKKTASVFSEAVKKGPYPGGSFPNPCLQGGHPKVKVEYTSTVLSALYYFV
jgi:hypothetical protein